MNEETLELCAHISLTLCFALDNVKHAVFKTKQSMKPVSPCHCHQRGLLTWILNTFISI